MLIDVGVSLNIRGKYDLTPLMSCCERKNDILVKKIVEINPKLIYDTNILGENAIQICQKVNNEDLAMYLMNISSDKMDMKLKSKKSIKPI